MSTTPGLPNLPRATLPLVAVLALAGALWTPAGVASADPGAEIEDSDIHVIQRNIGVIAGNDVTENTSSQTAFNVLGHSQDADATAGDTTEAGGGTARSGNAVARNRAIVIQINVQVIAGLNCSVDQVAGNVALLDQEANATSGDATAVGPGSLAQSGDARAGNVAVIKQMNKQIYICRGTDGGSGEQTALNVGSVGQLADAMTGDVSAGSGQTATSGDAGVINRARLDQHNTQLALD
jgi:hypothetical protein